MKKRLFTLVLLLFTGVLFGQKLSIIKQFRKISCPEKMWILKHPFCAKKAYKLTRLALVTVDSLMAAKALDSDANGGQIDAFRHAFWMALLSAKIGEKRAINFGKAHEKGNYRDFKKGKLEDGALPDSTSCEMDLWNNSIGAAIGANNKNISAFSLRDTVIAYILKGEMKIILKDSNKKALDCSGNPIKIENTKRWNLGKCLVRSDYFRE